LAAAIGLGRWEAQVLIKERPTQESIKTFTGQGHRQGKSLAMAAHPPITVVIISPPRPIVNFQ